MRQYVPPKLLNFAREMRKEATLAENMLWQAIRNKRLNGLKFRRQVPFDRYIIDFICFEARLIIELDGAQHSGSQSDLKRDAHFETKGFKTLRFWNNEILNNLDGICSHILHEAKK
ncbi:endonuclease domain-containing protein [Phyllobacterium sp. 628]|uniref:endonuclease domain-containing protein n=1 Tax=Phyllobacterium sp. 628 TaxID=2718938 RepID=UPI00166241FA|nr:DUF559 domain-containing protein [Phyllobacterium sp. 628]QND54271.1 endonuclease domain-containing protein [Phyllobacterium sp. 628]